MKVRLLLCLLLCYTAASAQTKRTPRMHQSQIPGNLKFVNPFIGNADNGHTFPGAAVLFGLVQPGPETGNAG